MRRAADELPAAELPAGLRPFAHWHPDRLLGDRPRRVLAGCLAADARLRAAVATALGAAEDDPAADLDLARLLARHGHARTAALLAAWGRFDDLAALAGAAVDHAAAARDAAADAAEPAAMADAERRSQRLSAKVARLRQERDGLRQRVDAAEAASRGAERTASASTAALEEALERLDQLEARLAEERRRGARREARLRDRADAAEERARLGVRRARQAEQTAQRLRDQVAPDRDVPGREGRDEDGRPAGPLLPAIPRGVAAAEPGRPCRLPPGIAGDTAEAVRALLQVPGQRLVLDGYNVTRDPRGRPAAGFDDQRRWLIGLAAGVHARFGVRVTIVFDGTDPVHLRGRRPRGVLVVYSSGEQTADERIVEILAAWPRDACVLVVTSDREVREHAAALDADVARSGAFLTAVESSGRGAVTGRP